MQYFNVNINVRDCRKIQISVLLSNASVHSKRILWFNYCWNTRMNSRWIFILNGLLLGLILLSNLFSSYRRMTYSKLKKPPHLHSRVEQLRSKSTTSQRRHKNKTLKIKAKASSLKPEVTKQIQQEQPKNTSILDREILVAKDKAHFYLSTLRYNRQL